MSAQAYTAEAVQQAIAQGAMTEAYQADPQQVMQELNQLRATEVTSYLQYKQHAYMAVSLFAPGLKNDFEAHATLELHHADLLAQRIQQLGGVPWGVATFALGCFLQDRFGHRHGLRGCP